MLRVQQFHAIRIHNTFMRRRHPEKPQPIDRRLILSSPGVMFLPDLEPASLCVILLISWYYHHAYPLTAALEDYCISRDDQCLVGSG